MIQSVKRFLCGGVTAALLLAQAPVCVAEAPGAERFFRDMSTRDRVCQMLMPEFRYYTDGDGALKSVTELYPEARKMMEEFGFGGVALSSENLADTEQSVRLIDAMQTATSAGGARPQLLVAADQEGGYVTRLGQGTQMPGNMALGAIGDPEAAETAAAIQGEECMLVGVNCDAAPVCDVNSNPANPVIGIRSFSDDPQTAAELALRFMKGLQASGTIATLKHFPGHGDTDTDSHTGLPCVDKSLDALLETELVPFQTCIDAGADAVMTAHIQYPRIETDTYTSKSTGQAITLPATLSHTILTGLLRERMGFDGVIITDAVGMGAIAQHFEPLDAARLAIRAGADIILTPVDTYTPEGMKNLKDYIAQLTAMVEADETLTARVDSAVRRILQLKERKGLLAPYDGSDLEARIQRAVATVGSKDHHAVEWDLAKRAVTVVKNDNGTLPLRGEGKTVILSTRDDGVPGAEYALGLLRDEGKLSDGMTAEVYSVKERDAAEVLDLVEGADHVILLSSTGSAGALDPSTNSGRYSKMFDAVIDKVHAAGGDVVVISILLPYDAARYPAADAVAVCYSPRGMTEDPRTVRGPVAQYAPNAPAALYLAFAGDETPAGTLPVSIPVLDESYHFTDEVLYPRGWSVYAAADSAPAEDSAPAGDVSAPVEDAPAAQDTPAFAETPVPAPAAVDGADADAPAAPGGMGGLLHGILAALLSIFGIRLG